MSEIPKIPLPNIEDLFDQMTGSKIFTTIDLASGYHQMLVVPSSKKYTAFRTHKELLQWVVAPMGMAGMPGTWSRLMRLLFDNCKNVVVYMDDLCIFSKSMTEHEADLRRVFEILRTNTLYARKIKCEFAKKSVKFLGHEISGEGLLVDSTKVRAIEERKPPTNRKELLSFLGLCGYYRKFISNYAHMILPMSNLVKEDSVWEWKEPQQRAFTQLKVALQQAPVLQLPDYTKPFRVTTDASGYCCGAVLSQDGVEGDDLPIAFLSKRFGKHEENWPAHEKELFAIVQALKKWRHYLHGNHFDIYTDNSVCVWFMKTPVLSAKLARWTDFFSQFDFTLHHRPGKENVVADALSRPPVQTIAVDAHTFIRIHACYNACDKHFT